MARSRTSGPHRLSGGRNYRRVQATRENDATGTGSGSSGTPPVVPPTGFTFVRSFSEAATSSTISIPAAGCAAGNLVVVVANCNNFPSGVSDSKSNTWTRGTSFNDGARFGCVMWSKLTTPLVSGDTITLAGATKISAAAVEFSGASASLLDKQAVSSAVSGAINSTDTATLTATNDLYIMGMENASSAATLTDTTPGLTTVIAGAGVGTVRLAYKILTTNTAIDYQGTLSTNSAGVWVGAFLAA